MIHFLIFVLVLSIVQIYWIIKNDKETKKLSIIIYCSMAIVAIILGLYYYQYRPTSSIASYIFKILKIQY
ncbi:MAG: hypothetical protein N2749_06285 [Clostridia bacterium]|nr:hypothetical protein [Clostridia bacterium]